jgi:serralysin
MFNGQILKGGFRFSELLSQAGERITKGPLPLQDWSSAIFGDAHPFSEGAVPKLPTSSHVAVLKKNDFDWSSNAVAVSEPIFSGGCSCSYCGFSGKRLSALKENPLRASSGIAQDNTSQTIPLSGFLPIDGLLTREKWVGQTITFAFPTSASAYTTSNANYPTNYLTNFRAFSAAYQAHARLLLTEVASFTALTFIEGTEVNATLRWGRFDDPANLAYAFIPSRDLAQGGDQWFANNSNPDPQSGEGVSHIMRHELGHALGLKHPQDGSVIMPQNLDSIEYSVMSYRQATTQVDGDFSGDYDQQEQSFMLLDVAALQYMYGANFNFNNSDTVYQFSATTGEMRVNGSGTGVPAMRPGSTRASVFRSIWDGGGTDTYDFSNFSGDQSINLTPGTWSTFSSNLLSTRLLRRVNNGPGPAVFAPGNIASAYQYAGDVRSLIENARGGAGNDTIVGNAAINQLLGNGGADTLEGGLGADILDGGTGFDFASYANATSGLTLFMGGGTFNSGEANGDTHTSIEGLIGSQFSDIIGADANYNELRGLNGNDFIYGRAGVDTLLGGDGNDVLDGGLDGDVLRGEAGIDVAYYRDATATVTASLLTGGTGGEATGDTYFDIENIWGSRFGDVLTGDNNGGQVYGFEGNDTLSGLGGDDFFYGGEGLDTLTGGTGVDNFFFLSWNDHFNQYGTLEPYEGGDTFTDFASGTDRIILSRYWFGFGNIGGPAAALTETHANFVTNGAAATSRPSLIWNQTNRTLSFDADGNGATQAVLLGTFQQGVTLTLGDIWTA